MQTKLPKAAAAAGLLLLAACAREEEPITQTGPVTEPEPGPVSAQMWVDDFEIGTELDANADILAEDTDIQPGEMIHVAMDVTDAPANTSVTVQWVGPEGNQLGYETKTIPAGEDRLSFTQDNTADWQAGEYRAEVWVGDEKVNEQEFQVVAG